MHTSLSTSIVHHPTYLPNMGSNPWGNPVYFGEDVLKPSRQLSDPPPESGAELWDAYISHSIFALHVHHVHQPSLPLGHRECSQSERPHRWVPYPMREEQTANPKGHTHTERSSLGKEQCPRKPGNARFCRNRSSQKSQSRASDWNRRDVRKALQKNRSTEKARLSGTSLQVRWMLSINVWPTSSNPPKM